METGIETKTGKYQRFTISTVDVEEVIYDKVGRTPQILNENESF